MSAIEKELPYIVKNSFSGDRIRFAKEFLTIVFPRGIKCGMLGKYQYTLGYRVIGNG